MKMYYVMAACGLRFMMEMIRMFFPEKAKGKRTSAHASWLRLYAIKLTPTMQERTHSAGGGAKWLFE